MKKTQYQELKDDIDDIKDNHLPSIYKRLWYVMGVLAVLLPLVIVILAKVW